MGIRPGTGGDIGTYYPEQQCSNGATQIGSIFLNSFYFHLLGPNGVSGYQFTRSDIIKMMGVVYKYTKRDDNSSYIGISINPLERIKTHKKALSKYSDFHEALRKYGYEAFDYDILEWCDETYLPEREIYWIDYYDTYYGNGYNLTPGGVGWSPGMKHTPESLEKMRGENHPNWGKPRSEETKKRVGDAQRGEKNHRYGKPARPGFVKSGEDNWMYGKGHLFTGENNHFYQKTHTYEVLQRLSDLGKERWLNKQIEQEKENGQLYLFYPYKT